MYVISASSDGESAEIIVDMDDGYEVTDVSTVGGRVRIRVDRAARKLIGRQLTVNGTTIVVKGYRYDRGKLWVESADTGDWMEV